MIFDKLSDLYKFVDQTKSTICEGYHAVGFYPQRKYLVKICGGNKEVFHVKKDGQRILKNKIEIR